MDLHERIEKIKSGDIRTLSRTLTCIEENSSERWQIVNALYGSVSQAVVWGVTGPPGCGKSTLINCLISEERKADRKVAVLSVDPSSPYSGGALLGDRIRMSSHAHDQGVYIRSLAARGVSGGLADAVRDGVSILDAAGFHTIIIETVGVGQNEVDIAQAADLVLLVLVPGYGDSIQFSKAGIIEIADMFVINKEDLGNAAQMKADLTAALQGSQSIIIVSAAYKKGIDELTARIRKHVDTLQSSGELLRKRKERDTSAFFHLVMAELQRYVSEDFSASGVLESWIAELHEKKQDPRTFVQEKVKLLLGNTSPYS